jgi:hypothetical protein
MPNEDEVMRQAKRYVDSALESRRRLGYAGAVSEQDYATAVARATAAFRELSAADPSAPSRSARAA